MDTQDNNLKYRHVYTVIREYDGYNAENLKDQIEFFNGAIKDETGEYLYGGTGENEKISVIMQVSHDNGATWVDVGN